LVDLLGCDFELVARPALTARTTNTPVNDSTTC
jgi:hypothetical protein